MSKRGVSPVLRNAVWRPLTGDPWELFIGYLCVQAGSFAVLVPETAPGLKDALGTAGAVLWALLLISAGAGLWMGALRNSRRVIEAAIVLLLTASAIRALGDLTLGGPRAIPGVLVFVALGLFGAARIYALRRGVTVIISAKSPK